MNTLKENLTGALLCSSILLSDEDLKKINFKNNENVYTSICKLPDGNNLLKSYVRCYSKGTN